MKPKSNDTLVLIGGAVKTAGDGTVKGYLVLFGDEKSKDLSGEYFTKSTDFDTDFPGKSSVYYHHALDPELGPTRMSETKAELGVDEVGVWIEAQLNMRDAYAAAVYKMADEGKLGWSSGTAPHLISKKSTGEITYWPLGLDASLTPTPCDSRNLVGTKSYPVALKSLSLPSFAQLTGRKSDGLSQSDKRQLLNRAVQQQLEAAGYWGYAYVCDVFDASLVFCVAEKYYEAPYALDGFVATLGEAVQVQEITKYVPVTATAPDPAPADGLKSARAFLDTLRGGSPSDVVLAELKGLRAELDTLLVPAPADHLKAFEAEVAAAFRLETLTHP